MRTPPPPPPSIIDLPASLPNLVFIENGIFFKHYLVIQRLFKNLVLRGHMRSLGNCRGWSVKGRGSQVEGPIGRRFKSRIEDRMVEGPKVEGQKFRPMSMVEKLNSLRVRSNLE